MPLVSFIVPVFNKARFLPAVLRALDTQEGDFSREFIFVDDGSSDESPTLLAAFAEGRDDVRVIRLEDEGPAFALNRAAAIADGTYLKMVDADDLLVPNALILLLKAITTHDAVLAYGTGASYDSKLLPDITVAPAIDAPSRRLDSPLGAILTDIPLMSTCLVRRDAFLRVGGCDERVFVHDMPMLYRLALVGAFAEVQTVLLLMPEQDPARWSNRNHGQVLHDVNLAFYWLLDDHDEVPPEIRRRAFHRAAGRAWKWAHRHGGQSLWSRYFLLNLLSYLPLPAGQQTLIGATLGAFHMTSRIRHGTAPRPCCVAADGTT